VKSRVVFVLFCVLIGALISFVASEIYAAAYIQMNGTGPHGYGTFLYGVAPMLFVPVGALAGLVLGFVLKVGNYRWLVGGLALVALATVGVVAQMYG
jgi:hypothetical protein